MKIPSVPSERRRLSRGVSATVEDRGVDVRVWFSALDLPRQILVGGIQEKADFLDLIRRFEARVDLFVDGQAYLVTKVRSSDFLEAADALFERYLPDSSIDEQTA